MDAPQLSRGNFRKRKERAGVMVPEQGKKRASPRVSAHLDEPVQAFDRATYERDGRVARRYTRWPVSIAIVATGLAMVFFGVHVVDELDRRDDRTWQKMTAPTSPPSGSPLAKPRVGVPPAAIPTAALREMRDRLIRGELDRETIEQFRNLPDYERCRQCLNECDAQSEEKAAWKAQECRRNCLRTCSEHARALLDL